MINYKPPSHHNVNLQYCLLISSDHRAKLGKGRLFSHYLHYLESSPLNSARTHQNLLMIITDFKYVFLL